MKKNYSYRQLLAAGRTGKIEVGTLADYCYYWWEYMQDSYYYNCWDSDERWIWPSFKSGMYHCKNLNEMENFILCFSCTDQEYGAEWREQRLLDYYKIDENKQINIREKFVNWGDDVEAAIKQYNKNNIDWGDVIYRIEFGLREICTDFLINKDLLREFKNIFEYINKFAGAEVIKINTDFMLRYLYYTDEKIELARANYNINILRAALEEFKFNIKISD